MSSKPVEPLRLGIAGLGLAGGIMASAAAEHPNVVIAGAADRDAQLRRRFERDFPGLSYDDLEGLLAVDAIEAVYIATPHQFHCEHAVRALQAGKHVIVEKPMALTLGECDAMIAAADANGRVLIVGHTHSFDPAITAMADVVKSGAAGDVVMLAMWNYTNFIYRPRRPEELDTERGGGILFNQIPHQVDIARFLIDSPVRSVRAVTAILDANRPTEGAASILIQFANDACASLTYSGYDRFDSDELHGWVNELGYRGGPSHGTARRSLEQLVDTDAERRARTERYGYGSALFAGAAPHQPHFGSFVLTCRNADLRQSENGILIYDRAGVREVELAGTAWRAGFGDVLDELHGAVRLDVPARHDGRFGRGTVETCLAILRSSRERREIVLSLESGSIAGN